MHSHGAGSSQAQSKNGCTPLFLGIRFAFAVQWAAANVIIMGLHSRDLHWWGPPKTRTMVKGGAPTDI